MLGADKELRGSRGDKDMSFTQLLLGGAVWQLTSSCKGVDTHELGAQQLQFQKFIIFMCKSACRVDTYHSIFIVVGTGFYL